MSTDEIEEDSFDDNILDDNFDEGHSLIGETYIAPVKEDKFVDSKGNIIDKKDVSPLMQMKAMAQANGMVLPDPKKGCRKCYGRGYTSHNPETKSFTPCSCVEPKMTPQEKVALLQMQYKNGQIKPTGQQIRDYRRKQKKEFAKLIHKKGLELLKKQAEMDKAKALSASDVVTKTIEQVVNSISATGEVTNG